jgi:2-dehydro-3-deoxygalactonokinase
MSIVALDVGSTNSRAWLLEDRRIVARAAIPTGVRDSAAAGTREPIRAVVRELIARVSANARPRAVAAAGMITSSLGLREVPHVEAPAGLDDLAAHVSVLESDVSPLPIALIPGVRTYGTGLLDRDVMRGEETLVVGLLHSGEIAPGSAVLNAGSHWKLIAIDDRSRIAMSRTSLGGELVHVVTDHTVLAEALPKGPLHTIQRDWLEFGVRACREHGLLRALFGVRLLQQEGTTPEQRQSWLVGAAIASDVDALLRAGAIQPSVSLAIAGAGLMPQAWTAVLSMHDVRGIPLEAGVVEQAFLTGLCAILERSGFPVE